MSRPISHHDVWLVIADADAIPSSQRGWRSYRLDRVLEGARRAGHDPAAFRPAAIAWAEARGGCCEVIDFAAGFPRAVAASEHAVEVLTVPLPEQPHALDD